MSQRYEKDPYEFLGEVRWSGVAVAGGTYEVYANGVKHTLGPIRLGPNWFQVGGAEMCIRGIDQSELDGNTSGGDSVSGQ